MCIQKNPHKRMLPQFQQVKCWQWVISYTQPVYTPRCRPVCWRIWRTSRGARSSTGGCRRWSWWSCQSCPWASSAGRPGLSWSSGWWLWWGPQMPETQSGIWGNIKEYECAWKWMMQAVVWTANNKLVPWCRDPETKSILARACARIDKESTSTVWAECMQNRDYKT